MQLKAGTTYFTICARNYLAYALTLRDSLLAVDPAANFIVFIADAPLDGSVPDNVEIIPVERLSCSELNAMAFRYTLMEFSTAIKPWCFEYLLDNLGYERAIYLDPDIFVYRPLEKVDDAFDDGASVVLTPHLLTPLEDDFSPGDRDILRSGTFNLGFAGFAKTAEAAAFLKWWKTQLTNHCLVDFPNGLFVDQKFVEFAPSFIDRLTVLRHPGYNVAYWNLANREVAELKNGWTVNGEPLVFFHFSGVIPDDGTVFSKYQDRFSIDNIGVVCRMLDDYLVQLQKNGHAHWTKLPYAYDFFHDGSRIYPPMRRQSGLTGSPKDWFRKADIAYWSAMSDRVDQTDDCVISRLMIAIYDTRPDLQQSFPLSHRDGRLAYRDWFLVHAQREYGFQNSDFANFTKGQKPRSLARLRRLSTRLLGRFQ